jgi:DNA-binding MarR family transcriptional regulator
MEITKMATPDNIIGFPPQENPPPDRSLRARWKHDELFDKGFVGMPARFLSLYAHLKPHPLSPGEALFVLQLMSFKWTDASPFPSYGRIAKRMGITDKMARRYAKSLEAKGYLVREHRISQTNKFDLTPLFDALLATLRRAQQEEAERAERANYV